jgi:hypothetical protein
MSSSTIGPLSHGEGGSKVQSIAQWERGPTFAAARIDRGQGQGRLHGRPLRGRIATMGR